MQVSYGFLPSGTSIVETNRSSSSYLNRIVGSCNKALSMLEFNSPIVFKFQSGGVEMYPPDSLSFFKPLLE